MQSNNKQTVTKYLEAHARLDHEAVLACLTNDVIWEMPGVYGRIGKAAFDKGIENDEFTGYPEIEITRLIEENNVVVAEGTVIAKRRDGTTLNAAFCDVFHMENGLIKILTTYVMAK